MRLPLLQECLRIHVASLDVLVGFNVEPFHIGHSQLFTLVNEGCTLHHVQARGQHFGRTYTVNACITKSRNCPRLIVVTPVQTVPACAMQTGLPAAEAGFQIG